MDKLFLMFIFGLITSINAYALDISIEDNVADNQYISQGTSINGQFDINSSLPSNGSFNQPYNLNSATAKFTFTDDGEAQVVGTTTTNYDYQYTSIYSCNCSAYELIYYRDSYTYFYDEFDQININLLTQSSTDGTTWYNENSYTGYESQYLTSWSQSPNGTWTRALGYTLNYDVNYGYIGTFTSEVILDNSNLALLSASGILDFTITSTYGDIFFDSGFLTADVTANPIPEPSSIFLIVTGLIGLAYTKKGSSD